MELQAFSPPSKGLPQAPRPQYSCTYVFTSRHTRSVHLTYTHSLSCDTGFHITHIHSLQGVALPPEPNMGPWWERILSFLEAWLHMCHNPDQRDHVSKGLR